MLPVGPIGGNQLQFHNQCILKRISANMVDFYNFTECWLLYIFPTQLWWFFGIFSYLVCTRLGRPLQQVLALTVLNLSFSPSSHKETPTSREAIIQTCR
jgi:hypothetical protein